MNANEINYIETLLDPHLDEILDEFKALVEKPWQWKERPRWECNGVAVYEQHIFTVVIGGRIRLYLYGTLMFSAPILEEDDSEYTHRLAPELRKYSEKLVDAVDEWKIKCAIEDFAIRKNKEEKEND